MAIDFLQFKSQGLAKNLFVAKDLYSKKHIYYIALHIRMLEIASFSFFHTCGKNNGTIDILKNK